MGVREDIDTYRETVLVLLGLIHEYQWSAERRRMEPDRLEHRHGLAQDAGDRQVTPDVAFVLDGHLLITAEIKLGFSPRVRSETIAQLQKYDAVGRAFVEGPGEQACTLLVVQLGRRADAIDELARARESGQLVTHGPIALITSSQVIQANRSLALDLVDGELLPEEKERQFRRPLMIALRHLKPYAIYFYDADPPMVLLLQVLWQELYSACPQEEFVRARQARQTNAASQDPVVTVDATAFAQILRDSYSMRSFSKQLPGRPRDNQVRNALRRLVKWGLGTQHGDEFTVKLKRLRPNPEEYFLEQESELERHSPESPDQQRLFEDEDEGR